MSGADRWLQHPFNPARVLDLIATLAATESDLARAREALKEIEELAYNSRALTACARINRIAKAALEPK